MHAVTCSRSKNWRPKDEISLLAVLATCAAILRKSCFSRIFCYNVHFFPLRLSFVEFSRSHGIDCPKNYSSSGDMSPNRHSAVFL